MKNTSITLHHVGGSLWGVGNLVRLCRESVYKVCPQMAESWESNADFTQWTFKIRDNLFWHDGTPVTAEDLKFWLELAVFELQRGGDTRSPAVFAAFFGDVKKVEALDRKRLRVTLARPAPQYLTATAPPYIPVAHPKHLMEPKINGGLVRVAPVDINFIAAGPFKMLSYEKGSRVQLGRFDRYWESDGKGRKLPYLDGLDFAIIRDPAAMDAAFRVGRLDGGTGGQGYALTKERYQGYVKDLGDNVKFSALAGLRSFFGFNVLKPGPFQDVRVRRAASLWLDKREYIASRGGGFGQLTSILAATNPYTSPDFLTWPGWNERTREADRAEAKRLMREAYPNGFSFDLACRRGLELDCEFMAAQLFAGLGIESKIVLLDAAVFTERVTLGLDYYIVTGGGGFGDALIPEMAMAEYNAYSITKTGYGKHEDAKIIEAFRAIGASNDQDFRIKTWRALERYLILEQAYVVHLGSPDTVIPYRSYVKGLLLPVDMYFNHVDFSTAWLDK
jgi:ABC-type transport system substrate-binding protein